MITRLLFGFGLKKLAVILVGVLVSGGVVFGGFQYFKNINSLREELASARHSEQVLNEAVLAQQEDRSNLIQAIAERDATNKELATRWISIRNTIREINDDEAVDWRNTDIPDTILRGLLSIEEGTSSYD